MKRLKLKNIGTVPVGGQLPGAEFTIKVDDDGVPLDHYWRRRLADEEKHGCGAIAVLAETGAAKPADPKPQPKKPTKE